jgi:hypothetical protein
VFGAISVAAPASAFEGVDVAELVATLRAEGASSTPRRHRRGMGRRARYVRAIPS